MGAAVNLPVSLPLVVAALGALMTLLVLWRIINQPGPNDFINVEYGAYLGLILVAALTYGAILAGGGVDTMRAEAESLQSRATSGGGTGGPRGRDVRGRAARPAADRGYAGARRRPSAGRARAAVDPSPPPPPPTPQPTPPGPEPPAPRRRRPGPAPAAGRPAARRPRRRRRRCPRRTRTRRRPDRRGTGAAAAGRDPDAVVDRLRHVGPPSIRRLESGAG